jgi:hypothetical protein
MAERSKAAVLKSDQGPIGTSRIAPDFAISGRNLPVAILSRPVQIHRLATRLLHNLLHSAMAMASRRLVHLTSALLVQTPLERAHLSTRPLSGLIR